jgi:phosphopantothenoylcysteine decarboxylase/phosphopantothenate--cysteine ligase
MEMAVADAVRGADVLLMSAALSDYRPEERRTQKLKKDAIGETMAFGLVANPDVLAGVDEPGLIKIGFAAETESLVENARRKLAVKSLDLIVANDAEATIGNLNSQAVIIAADGSIESLDEMPKQELAEIIIKRAAQLLEVRSPQEP